MAADERRPSNCNCDMKRALVISITLGGLLAGLVGITFHGEEEASRPVATAKEPPTKANPQPVVPGLERDVVRARADSARVDRSDVASSSAATSSQTASREKAIALDSSKDSPSIRSLVDGFYRGDPAARDQLFDRFISCSLMRQAAAVGALRRMNWEVMECEISEAVRYSVIEVLASQTATGDERARRLLALYNIELAEEIMKNPSDTRAVPAVDLGGLSLQLR